jgi:hypothetical protein
MLFAARMKPAVCLALVSLLAACAPTSDLPDEDESAVESEDAATGTALRFDVATLDCASSSPGEVCAPGDDHCLCRAAFDHLNHGGEAHFVVVGTDKLKGEIAAKGNRPAAYVDDLNTGYGQMSGAARADALMTTLGARFPSGVPQWIVMNEISAGTWPDDAAYRAWVVAFAKRMKTTYGKNMIVAAPFTHPGYHADAWSALSKYAFIAAELYLTGKEINKSGNSVSYCRDKYESSIASYENVGVPRSRLMMIEHFGSTASDAKWGRAGVSVAGWKNAIVARSKAAKEAGFAGYLSYSWGSNQMHETQAQRLEYVDAYAKTDVLP